MSEPVKKSKSQLHASALVFAHKEQHQKFSICAVVVLAVNSNTGAESYLCSVMVSEMIIQIQLLSGPTL